MYYNYCNVHQLNMQYTRTIAIVRVQYIVRLLPTMIYESAQLLLVPESWEKLQNELQKSFGVEDTHGFEILTKGGACVSAIDLIRLVLRTCCWTT